MLTDRKCNRLGNGRNARECANEIHGYLLQLGWVRTVKSVVGVKLRMNFALMVVGLLVFVLVAFIVLIVVGLILLFRVLFRLLWRLGTTFRLVRGSRLVTDLVGRLVRPVATLIGLFVGLSVIGVETTTLLAGLGIFGLVVGFALQDSLSNLFAGFAILASHAFDVDDVVEVAGIVGKIRQLGLWNTTLVTFDGRRMLIPNRNIWGSNVENRSVEPNRRADAVARIGYDSDLQAAIAVLEELLRDDERVLEDPAPRVWVSQLDESWAEVRLWAWARTSKWWSLYSDLPRLVRGKLAAAGIEVPVPRRDVTMRAAKSKESPVQSVR